MNFGLDPTVSRSLLLDSISMREELANRKISESFNHLGVMTGEVVEGALSAPLYVEWG